MQQEGGDLTLVLGNLLGGWNSKALDSYPASSPHLTFVPFVPNRAFADLCDMTSTGDFRPCFELFKSLNLHIYGLSLAVALYIKALCRSLLKNKLVLSL